MSEAFQAASQPSRTTLTFAPALSVIATIGCTPAVATTMPKLSKVPLNLDSGAVNIGQQRVAIDRATAQISTASTQINGCADDGPCTVTSCQSRRTPRSPKFVREWLHCRPEASFGSIVCTRVSIWVPAAPRARYWGSNFFDRFLSESGRRRSSKCTQAPVPSRTRDPIVIVAGGKPARRL